MLQIQRTIIFSAQGNWIGLGVLAPARLLSSPSRRPDFLASVLLVDLPLSSLLSTSMPNLDRMPSHLAPLTIDRFSERGRLAVDPLVKVWIVPRTTLYSFLLRCSLAT